MCVCVVSFRLIQAPQRRPVEQALAAEPVTSLLQRTIRPTGPGKASAPLKGWSFATRAFAVPSCKTPLTQYLCLL